MINDACNIYEIIKFYFVWFEWNVYKMIWRALVFIYDYLFTLTLKMSLIWLLKWMNFRAQEFYGVARCHPRFLWYLMQKMFQAELHKTKAGNQLLHTQLKSSFGWEGCEIAWETEGGMLKVDGRFREAYLRKWKVATERDALSQMHLLFYYW